MKSETIKRLIRLLVLCSAVTTVLLCPRFVYTQDKAAQTPTQDQPANATPEPQPAVPPLAAAPPAEPSSTAATATLDGTQTKAAPTILKGNKKAKNAISKKKLKKHQKVKYRDLNVVMGIRKEVYFDFPVSTTNPPFATNKNVFDIKLEKKEQNPKLEKDRVVLTARSEGVTDLWVYDDKDILKFVYNVTVTRQNLKRVLGFLKQEFKNIEGLKMYIREQLIVLDGEILLPEDIARIHQVITGFENVFKIQFKLNPSLYNIIAEKMEKEIGLPDVHVEVINQRFVIKGNVKSRDEFDYVSYKAALYLPKYFYIPAYGDPTNAGDLVAPAEEFRDQPIINYFLTIAIPETPINKVIKIVVYFVELAKGFQNDFGFTWAPSLDTTNSKMNLTYSTNSKDSSGNEIQPFVGTITGIINNFIPKLKDAVDHKRGRVIQSAAISVEDGGKEGGTIQKMTSYPYLITAPNSAPTTQFAKVGIGVGLTPTILGNKATSADINLGIKITVSQVVSMSTIGVPVSSENSVSTYVNMKSDETAAIGGIVNNISSRSYGNGGADDNIIINLSRSKSFQKDKSQFVVFITPTILKSTSEGSEDAKEKFRIR
ncbi:MAG: hypothetical protein NTY22_02030 [Proteobacteria bacterium]|nr:hypothetical protein [Pseudomonadota bacterium]